MNTLTICFALVASAYLLDDLLMGGIRATLKRKKLFLAFATTAAGAVVYLVNTGNLTL